MKNLFLVSSLLGLFLSIGNATAVAAATNMDHLRGRIVIQVEDHGEAWYVLPTTTERVYVKNGEAAYAALRNFGLGISNADLWQIPLGVQQPTGDIVSFDTDYDGLADKLENALGTNPRDADTDGDGYGDLVEFNSGYNPYGAGAIPLNADIVNRLKGHILLQVESRGEAWYVNPDDGKRYYMADGDWAYDLMRAQSLGITNLNLSHVPIFSGVLDCDTSIDCMIGSIEAFTDFEGILISDISLFGQQIQTWSKFEYSATKVASRYPWTWTTLQQRVNGVDQPDAVGVGEHCRSNHYSDLIDILENAKLGNYSTEYPSTVLCDMFGTE